MKIEKWVVFGLIGCALLAFGYMVYQDQHQEKKMQKMPLAVAAVQGGGDSLGSSLKSAPQVAVDYTNSLHDDANRARRNTEKYNADNKAREAQVQQIE